jgi:hypothetical protein
MVCSLICRLWFVVVGEFGIVNNFFNKDGKHLQKQNQLLCSQMDL